MVSGRDAGRDRGLNLGLIPARSGSQGVPDKNLRDLGGMPLVAHSILSARASQVFAEVYVSTDDREIAEVAGRYGARVIPRPAELAQSDTPMPPVIRHAIDWVAERQAERPQRVFLMQPTSPFRSPADIRQAASLLDRGNCESAMGVFEADDPPQWSLQADERGLLQAAYPRDQYLSRRQDLRPNYFDGAIYAAPVDAFLRDGSFLTARTGYFVIPRLRAIDIDTEMDFLFAEFLLARGLIEQPRGPTGPARIAG